MHGFICFCISMQIISNYSAIYQLQNTTYEFVADTCRELNKTNDILYIYIIYIFTQSYIQSDTTIYIHIRPMIMTLIDSNCGYK